jgi:hypothetical protein
MPPGILYLDGADAERNFPHPAPASSDLMSVGAAAGNAATVVLPANTSSPNFIGQVEWSYSGNAVTGRLQIVGAFTIRDYDIVASGPGKMDFNPPLDCGPNQAVTITLGGVAAITGKVGVVAWQLK